MIDRSRLFQRFIRRFSRKPAPRTLQKEPPVRRLPPSPQAAAKALIDQRAMRSSSHRSRVINGQRYHGCHPEIVAFYKALQGELNARNMPFYPFEFHRSDARQAELRRQGRSKAGPGQSPHNHGMAVDVVSSTRFWDLTPKEWAVIGAIGKEVARRMKIPIEWGGDWRFYDPAHWELADWREWVHYRGQTAWPDLHRQVERDQYRREFRQWQKAQAA